MNSEIRPMAYSSKQWSPWFDAMSRSCRSRQAISGDATRCLMMEHMMLPECGCLMPRVLLSSTCRRCRYSCSFSWHTGQRKSQYRRGRPARENSNKPNSGEEADQISFSAPAAAALHTVRLPESLPAKRQATTIPSLPSVVPCAFYHMPNIHIADR